MPGVKFSVEEGGGGSKYKYRCGCCRAKGNKPGKVMSASAPRPFPLASLNTFPVHMLTGREHEAPRREAKVPGPVQLAHAAHVSGQGVLSGALVRPRKAVDSLAALQVSEHVGPVAASGRGRTFLPQKFQVAVATRTSVAGLRISLTAKPRV